MLPLYLDSPMASKATDIYRRHPEYYDEETRRLLRAAATTPLDYPDQIVTNDVKDSQAIARAQRPYMIVASNGMLTGGRVVGHLRDLIDDPSAVLLFVGYQGEGTLGAHLQAGRQQVTHRRRRSGGPLPGPLDQRLLGPRRRVGAARLDRQLPAGKSRARPGYPRRSSSSTATPTRRRARAEGPRGARLRLTIPHWHEHVDLG